MSVRSSSSAQSINGFNVAGTLPTNTVKVGDDIRRVAQLFSHADKPLARRLTALGNDLDSQNFANWVDIDLYQTFNPSRAEDTIMQAYDVGTDTSNTWELLRNILVLGPILLTWFALSKASGTYAALLTSPAHRADRNLPFLLLWQRNFDGLAPRWLSFSSVALMDSALILAIILLTAIVHSRSGFGHSAASRKANDARQQLENAIWIADRALQPHRVSNPRVTNPNAFAQYLDQSLKTAVSDITQLIAPAANQFQMQSDHLVKLLESQQQRLDDIAKKRKADVDVLSNFVHPFTSGAHDLQDAAKVVQQSIAHVQPVMRDIKDNTAHLQQLATHQHQLMATTGAAMGQVVNHERIMAQELRTTTTILRDTADRNEEVAAELVKQAGHTSALVRDIVDP